MREAMATRHMRSPVPASAAVSAPAPAARGVTRGAPAAGAAAEQAASIVATDRRGVLGGMLGTLAAPAAQAAQPAVPPPPLLPPPPQRPQQCPAEARGAAAARDPAINAGCATPAAVREERQLGGLVPPRQVDLDVEVLRAKAALDACSTPLEKHRLLVTLKSTNQAAFLALLRQDLEGLLPLVYTPTIGEACLSWGSLLPRPAGLYVTSADRGHVASVLERWPSDEVRLAVVTDGARVLGLGDLGAHGMGIPTGKCTCYEAAGAPPQWLLPVTVDVGTDNRRLREDPLYVGSPVPRARGPEVDGLMDEVVAALQARFGRRVLLHWEDLAGSEALPLLERTARAGVPTFNDDIQATGACALAALLGACAVPGVPPLRRQRFLFFGAGQANLGTAQLLVRALQQQQGVAPADARASIWMVDSKGLILEGREGLTPGKAEFARPPGDLHSAGAPAVPGAAAGGGGLEAIVAAVRPTALIGAAAVPGAFDERVVSALVQSTQAVGGPGARPIVLALSNPTSRAEVSYADAMQWSGGLAVYASGSPFPALHAALAAAAGDGSGRDAGGGGAPGSPAVRRPAQANNVLVFPGLGLGTVRSGARTVSSEMLLAAARAVAGCVSAEELAEECVLPRIRRLPEVTRAVEVAVAEAARAGGLV